MPNLARAPRLILCSLLTVSATSAFAAGPNVLNNARHDTSLPLTQLAGRGRMPAKQPDREMAEPRATRGALASGRDDYGRPISRFWMKLAAKRGFVGTGQCIEAVPGHVRYRISRVAK